MQEKRAWYNYDTEKYDYLIDLPDDFTPYLPNNNPAYRGMYEILVNHKGKRPVDAYIEVLEIGKK